MTISTVAGYALQKSLPCDNTFIEYWTATGPTGLAEVFFFDPVLLKRFQSLPAWGPFSTCLIGEQSGKAYLVVQDPVKVSLVDLQPELSKGELIGLMWHVTSALAEVHDNGNAHGFISAEFIGFNESGELRIQPDPSKLFYQDTDTTSSAIATDSALIGSVFKRLELLDQNNPSMQLLHMGLNQDLSRLRLQPATAIRQSISALAARYPDWEKQLIKRYGPVFALDQVPKPEQNSRVRSYSSRRRTPSVNNELWNYSPYEQNTRTQVPSAESMGQYLLRESLKQQGAALTDIEDEAPIEADAQQEIPSALRVQVPLIPTNSSGDIPLTAWDDDDDDSDDFASYGGAASIDLGVASPLSHMTVANVQPVQPSPQKRPKVEVLDAPDFKPQMAPVAQQQDQAVVHPAKIKVKIDSPVMSYDEPFLLSDDDDSQDFEDDTAEWAAGFANVWKAEQSLIGELDELSEERPLPTPETSLPSAESLSEAELIDSEIIEPLETDYEADHLEDVEPQSPVIAVLEPTDSTPLDDDNERTKVVVSDSDIPLQDAADAALVKPSNTDNEGLAAVATVPLEGSDASALDLEDRVEADVLDNQSVETEITQPLAYELVSVSHPAESPEADSVVSDMPVGLTTNAESETLDSNMTETAIVENNTEIEPVIEDSEPELLDPLANELESVVSIVTDGSERDHEPPDINTFEAGSPNSDSIDDSVADDIAMVSESIPSDLNTSSAVAVENETSDMVEATDDDQQVSDVLIDSEVKDDSLVETDLDVHSVHDVKESEAPVTEEAHLDSAEAIIESSEADIVDSEGIEAESDLNVDVPDTPSEDQILNLPETEAVETIEDGGDGQEEPPVDSDSLPEQEIVSEEEVQSESDANAEASGLAGEQADETETVDEDEVQIEPVDADKNVSDTDETFETSDGAEDSELVVSKDDSEVDVLESSEGDETDLEDLSSSEIEQSEHSAAETDVNEQDETVESTVPVLVEVEVEFDEGDLVDPEMEAPLENMSSDPEDVLAEHQELDSSEKSATDDEILEETLQKPTIDDISTDHSVKLIDESVDAEGEQLTTVEIEPDEVLSNVDQLSAEQAEQTSEEPQYDGLKLVPDAKSYIQDLDAAILDGEVAIAEVQENNSDGTMDAIEELEVVVENTSTQFSSDQIDNPDPSASVNEEISSAVTSSEAMIEPELDEETIRQAQVNSDEIEQVVIDASETVDAPAPEAATDFADVNVDASFEEVSTTEPVAQVESELKADETAEEVVSDALERVSEADEPAEEVDLDAPEPVEAGVSETDETAEEVDLDASERVEAGALEADETAEEVVSDALDRVEADALEADETAEEVVSDALDRVEADVSETDETAEEVVSDALDRVETGASEADEPAEEVVSDSIPPLDPAIDGQPEEPNTILEPERTTEDKELEDNPKKDTDSVVTKSRRKKKSKKKNSVSKGSKSLPFEDKSRNEPSWASLANQPQSISKSDELGAGKWTESGRSSAEIELSLGSSSVREFEIDHGGSAWGMIIVAVVAVVVVVVGFWAINHNEEEAAMDSIANVEDVMEARPSVTRTVRIETEPENGIVIFDDIEYGKAPVSVPLPDDYDQEHTLCVQWGEDRRSCRQVRRGDFSAGTYYFELNP